MRKIPKSLFIIIMLRRELSKPILESTLKN